MKKLPVDFFSFTEIGGVGEMIYKAVRFPEYVVERTEDGNQVVVPLFSGSLPPEGGTDYALTGQDLLVSLCNLYQKINAPDSTVVIADAVRDWCKANVHPYNIDLLCEELGGDRYAHIKMMDIIRGDVTFEVDRFVNDLCNLGTAFELSFALMPPYIKTTQGMLVPCITKAVYAMVCHFWKNIVCMKLTKTILRR